MTPRFRISRRLGRVAFGTLMRLAIGVIFVWSGVGKLDRPIRFADDVYEYRLTNARATILIASSLPSVEIAIGACLVLNTCTIGAALGSAMLLSAFTVIQIVALHRGLKVPCGCFVGSGTTHDEMIGAVTIGRTVRLATVAYAYLWWLLAKRGQPDLVTLESLASNH